MVIGLATDFYNRLSRLERFRDFQFSKIHAKELSSLQRRMLGLAKHQDLPTIHVFKYGRMFREIIGVDQCRKLEEILVKAKEEI
jgi:hypothetical protein